MVVIWAVPSDNTPLEVLYKVKVLDEVFEWIRVMTKAGYMPYRDVE